MKLFFVILISLLVCNGTAYSQRQGIDKVQFFKEEKPVKATLEAYWRKLINQKNAPDKVFSARFKAVISDTTNVDEPVQLIARGHFRRNYCNLPPLKISFYKSDSSVMYPLKSLKLVSSCRFAYMYDQYLLKEFLIYKMYNLITEKSFRVRLIQLDYKDSSDKKNADVYYSFLVEDAKDLAKRNECKETEARFTTQTTNRRQMTIVAIFEYMIGNTDWSVPAAHNIKFLRDKKDSLSQPFCVPYDFDYCGMVNAEYATPDPLLNTETVVERVYRGYPRTMEELKETLDIFRQQKEKLYALVSNCDLLSANNKKSMLNYLDTFYDNLKDERGIKSAFITNARYD